MLHRASFVLGASESLFGWTSRGVVLTAVSSVVAEQAARWIPGASVGVLPNGVDVAFWRGARTPSDERRDRVRHGDASVTQEATAAPDARVRGGRAVRRRRAAMRLIVAGAGPDAEAMRRLGDRAGRRRPSGARRTALTRPSSDRCTVERTSSSCRASASRSAWRRSRRVRPVCRSIAMQASGVRDFIRQGVDGLLARDDDRARAASVAHGARRSLPRLRAASERDDRSAVRLVRRARAAPRDVRARGATPRLAATGVGGAGPACGARPEHAGRREREEVAEVLERGEAERLLGRRRRSACTRGRRTPSYTPTLPGTIGSSVERLSIASARTAAPTGRSSPNARCMQTMAHTSTAFFTNASASAPPPRRVERSGASAAGSASSARASRSGTEPARPLLAARRDSRWAPARHMPRDAPNSRSVASAATSTISPSAARVIHSGSGASDRRGGEDDELGDADEQLIHREHRQGSRALQAGQRDEQHDTGRFTDEQGRRVEHARRRRHDAQHPGEGLRWRGGREQVPLPRPEGKNRQIAERRRSDPLDRAPSRWRLQARVGSSLRSADDERRRQREHEPDARDSSDPSADARRAGHRDAHAASSRIVTKRAPRARNDAITSRRQAERDVAGAEAAVEPQALAP